MKSIKTLSVRAMRKCFSPLIPARKQLPFDYWLHFLNDSSCNELRYVHRITSQHDVAIDVGANQGLFSYNMSKHFRKVYSFEINEALTKSLAAYNPGNIELIHKGLSSEEGTAILYIPVLNALPLTGWASLAPGNCPETQEHIEKPVTITTLDSLNLNSVSLIKIDVEGHEVEVLKGAYNTLKQNRPVVIIEIKQQNVKGAFALFNELNYQQTNLQDLIGATGSPQDYIFVPR